MTSAELHDEISQKESDKEKIANQVIDKPELLEVLFSGLESDKASTRYGSEKVLRIISEKKPQMLDDRIDFFIANLDSDNTFFRLGAINVLANLTRVDSKMKFEAIFAKFFTPIPGPTLITAANTIAAAAKIAQAKPHLSERITKELLKVETAEYQTPDCRDIAIGHAVRSFAQFLEQIEEKTPVLKFVEKQLDHPRKSTRDQAAKILQKYSPAR